MCSHFTWTTSNDDCETYCIFYHSENTVTCVSMNSLSCLFCYMKLCNSHLCSTIKIISEDFPLTADWLYIYILYWQELDHVVEELEKIAVVKLLQHRSIISLIGNVQRSSLILEKVLHLVLPSEKKKSFNSPFRRVLKCVQTYMCFLDNYNKNSSH